MATTAPPAGLEITPGHAPQPNEILTPEALAFIVSLHRSFEHRRRDLLQQRVRRQADLDGGATLDFLPAKRSVREDPSWQVAPTPPDLQNRRVEITGPTDRKMMINALNSGARVFMADCEDAGSPTWENVIGGQVNLRDAARRTITFDAPEGRQYALGEKTAVLFVRPRGWHLVEKHVHLDGEPVSASLFDFGLYFYHNARTLLDRGGGPYFYLPKLQGYREARLWNDVFLMAQEELRIPRGSIRATVLIETLPAAFEMEEILYELREHSAGLNAGRWDYIFSVIKTGRNAAFHLPDRSQVTMTVPFMRAYTELLVRTCHRRGAHAIGGMAAFIPSRQDPEVTRVALEKVREDKERESKDGFDGTWVAHPGLVPVAMEVFDACLGERPHQKDRLREDVRVTAADLTDFAVPGGTVTDAGFRHNVNVALLYVEAWLRGTGCVPLYNLMEDAATAEISRSQLWQWIHRSAATLDDGGPIDATLYRRVVAEEMERIRTTIGEERFEAGRFDEARAVLDEVVLAETFTDFLTLVAYDHLD